MQYVVFILIVLYIGQFVVTLINRNKGKKAYIDLQNNLKEGDVVLTSGGLVGAIKKIDSDYLLLEISKDVVVKLDRSAILKVMENE